MMTELSRSAGLLVVLLAGCASNKHAIYNSEYADRVSEAETRLNERVAQIQRTCTDRTDCDRQLFEAQTQFESEREQYEAERDARVHASNRKGVADSTMVEAVASGLKAGGESLSREDNGPREDNEPSRGPIGYCSGVQPMCIGHAPVCACDSLGGDCRWGCVQH